jgi:predicted amidophosphoribosyltransferase
MGASNKVCPNCGHKMKQQFIGLQHFICGMSWKKDTGFFERTSDMVFALQRKVVKKSKNQVKTKQVPVIRYKENTVGADTPKGGANPPAIICDGKKYERIKVGEAGDFYEDGNADTLCTDCGAKYGQLHRRGCDCEICPVCGGQLLTCGCNIKL